MSRPTLAERVRALEEQVAELLKNAGAPAEAGPTDWRRAIGLFANNDLMKQIDAAGQAWRERDRRQALRTTAGRQRAKR